MNKKFKNILIILVVALIVFFSLMLIGNKMRADVIKEEQEQQNCREWLAENCECLKQERIYCPKGFEMIESRCYREIDKTYTFKLAACSEYNCSGEIKLFNFKKDKWEIK